MDIPTTGSILITIRARSDPDFPEHVFATIALYDVLKTPEPAEFVSTSTVTEAVAQIDRWLGRLVDQGPK